jgi:hypothetical protein
MLRPKRFFMLSCISLASSYSFLRSEVVEEDSEHSSDSSEDGRPLAAQPKVTFEKQKRVLVNGLSIQGKGVVPLSHNDRIIVGKSFTFRDFIYIFIDVYFFTFRE